MMISAIVKESDGIAMRAEIHDTPDGYSIQFYGANGFIKSETYHGKSIHYVEDAAQNWIDGIKVLNG
jgi:hypothetical protein